ncbi:hypothetical protein BCR37DRAFT_395007 [Protomyces lactucae-debilis]|uniref:Uncharacterized protein n=1 Tax=Protomyces lactucae-debilis TaxID=2754530 RepID=A0A1Y2F1M3_PROLT|nr:uncharacterized protein BCR37DRAFT_395007 [Protomyces lactucae-debilis]ORY77394.1 hypothetical protein BCR37DRAFT_395007 [Protomyces lactucae-debilis]
MPLASLKQLCLNSCSKHIRRLDSLGDEGLLPVAVIAQLLKHVLPDHLLKLEERSPWLAQTAEAQAAWQAHVLRVFPRSGEEYELGDPQLDWRAAYQILLRERSVKEAASRARLREKYMDLDARKSGKQIKTLEKVPRVVSGRGSASSVVKKGGLMGKAMKGAVSASLRVHAGSRKGRRA